MFKVASRATVTRLHEQLSESKRRTDQGPTAGLLHMLSDLADGVAIGVAAAKVAKRRDHRVKREIEILRDVQHPNLIEMLSHDQAAEPTWYAMRVMKGGTLKGRRDLVGNVRDAVRGMLQLARALAALHTHANPITHRDIKPGNVFVSETGAWILGDPGVAYRDDDGDETVTRPVSKDWAPRWPREELARSPKADLYMLGATVLSVLLGGSKPLDPAYLDEEDFQLLKRFPHVAGIAELDAVIRSLFVSKPTTMPHENAVGLVRELEQLLPLAENVEAWRLRQELAQLRREPELLVSFVNSNTHLQSGDHPGLQRILVRLPSDCTRLLCWQRGDQGHCCRFVLADEGHHQVQREVTLADDVVTAIDVPESMRGRFARVTIGGQSGRLHSLSVCVERS